MATPVTKSVKPSGGDYTTLAAWQAGEVTDLVAADEIAIAEIDGDWSGGADTALVNITGWTTDATRYIEIKTLVAARHHGRWSTDYYILDKTAVDGYALRIGVSNVIIDGLQLDHSGDGGNIYAITMLADTVNIVIKDCLGQITSADGGQCRVFNANDHNVANSVIFVNCAVLSSKLRGFSAGTDSSVIGTRFYNCTTRGCLGVGFYGSANTFIAINCLGDGAGVNDYSPTGGATGSKNNASSDTTAPGTSPRISQTFTWVGSSDSHIDVDDAGARTYGFDLSADAVYSFNIDVDGNTRSGSWDIGADQFVAVVDEKEIAESGGDYTTLAAWEAGEQDDIIHEGKIASAKITGVWTADDSTQMILDGWISSKGNYTKIYTDGAARHNGIWVTTAHRLKPSSTTAHGFKLAATGNDGCRIEGLQITVADVPTGVVWGISASAISDLQISHCIIRGPNHANAQRGIQALGSINAKVWNNVLYDWVSNAVNASGSKFYIYNNTCIGGSAGITSVVASDVIAKNNIVQDATTNYSGTFDGTSTNNLDDDGTAPGGSPQNNKTLTFADKVGKNFRLIVTDAAVDNGANLSADSDLPISDDIIGRTRCAPWEIGAFEFIDGGEGDDDSVALVGAVMRKSDRRRMLYAEDF